MQIPICVHIIKEKFVKFYQNVSIKNFKTYTVKREPLKLIK